MPAGLWLAACGGNGSTLAPPVETSGTSGTAGSASGQGGSQTSGNAGNSSSGNGGSAGSANGSAGSSNAGSAGVAGSTSGTAGVSGTAGSSVNGSAGSMNGSSGTAGTSGSAGAGGGTSGSAGNAGSGGMIEIICGDGNAQGFEQCDKADLRGQTCESIGFSSGTLACAATGCVYDTSNCKGVESCFDGYDNDGDMLIDCNDTQDCAAACSASSCTNVTAIADPSGSILGTTNGHSNQIHSSCTSQPGNSGPDIVYAITAQTTGKLDVSLQSASDLSLSLRTACDDAMTESACSETTAGVNDIESLSVPVTQGQTIFVVVDGNQSTNFGSFFLTAKSRPIECGDGIKDESEACDDGNKISNDGCSSMCEVESSETEPNDSSTTANTWTMDWTASIATTSDVDYVKINVTEVPSALTATLTDLGDGSCASQTVDSYLEVFDSNGTTLLAEDDDSGEGLCSHVVAGIKQAGTYYVKTSTVGNAGFPYHLALNVTKDVCGDGFKSPNEECDDMNLSPGDGCSPTCTFEFKEMESNNTTTTANPYSAPFLAQIAPVGDQDVVSVTIVNPNSTLVAQTKDIGNGACSANLLDTVIEIIDKNQSSVLITDDDSGAGYCSFAKLTGLAPGTYFVRVKAGTLSTTFPYILSVDVQ
jgi:cysteine-rich repeat protein